MKVRGDFPPSNVFSVEERPDKPGIALARFFQNARPFTEKQDELTIEGYEYEEYHLELPYYQQLEDDIRNNYDTYLESAIAEEHKRGLTPESLGSRLDIEEDVSAQQDEMLIDQEMRLLLLELGIEGEGVS